MIEIVPYRAEHLALISPTEDAAAFKAMTAPAVARALEGPFAKTAFLDGSPIGCAGICNRWYGNWLAWAYLSEGSGKHMLALTRAIRRAMLDLPKGRIEATTAMDYPAGRRWLEMLGFTCETPSGMANYMPDGRSFMLYSQVL